MQMVSLQVEYADLKNEMETIVNLTLT